MLNTLAKQSRQDHDAPLAIQQLWQAAQGTFDALAVLGDLSDTVRGTRADNERHAAAYVLAQRLELAAYDLWQMIEGAAATFAEPEEGPETEDISAARGDTSAPSYHGLECRFCQGTGCGQCQYTGYR